MREDIIDVWNGVFKSKDKNVQDAWSGCIRPYSLKNSLLEITGNEIGEGGIGSEKWLDGVQG